MKSRNKKDKQDKKKFALLGSPSPDIHKNFEKKIRPFFADRLLPDELGAFLTHYDACAQCREEVSIQFLIHEGLSRLESGKLFNLQRELDLFVEQERAKLKRRILAGRLVFGFEFITLLLVGIAVFWAVRMGVLLP